ncbi:MAG TPA: glycosyltransferase [Acidimicrobiales bacterium]|nr:glycosyltransferase [Acidimicrobiales bacterium]
MDDTSRPCRVLWLVKGLGPGGAERLLVSAATVGDRKRFSYEAAYLVPAKDHLVPALERRGVPVHCLAARRALDLRWTARLRHLLVERRFDVVHLHSPLVAGLARPVVRSLPAALRPVLVSTEHNVWPSYHPGTRLVNGATAFLDDARLAVSETVHSSVPARLRKGMQVIVNGVDVDAAREHLRFRDEVRAELGIGAAEVVVGTVANLRRAKAYPDLLAAARRVIDAQPAARFVAVGQGPLEPEIRALHHRLDLGDRFLLLGYREDALRVLAGCDVFALASHNEGFPVAVMEALALGIPIVGTAVGAIPQAVSDGVHGRIVPPGRPDLLGDAIVELVADASLRRRMAGAAAVRGRDFPIDRAVADVEAVYRSVVGMR